VRNGNEWGSCVRGLRTGLWLAMAAALSAGDPARAEAAGARPPERYAVVGASIGKAWDLPAFPARMHLPGVSFEYEGVFDFDKSQAVAALLARQTGRPDAIVLKECASYFPGDLARYERLLRSWIAASRAAGVVPIVATVSPVVRPRGIAERLRAMVKTRLLGRPDPNAQIREYNDRVRRIAADEGIPLLDLETALRVSDSDRSLRPDLTSGDGLHLDAKAYERLDAALAELVSSLR